MHTPNINNNLQEFGLQELIFFAKKYELDKVAKNRFSLLFVHQMFIYKNKYGIEPFEIIEAIKELEADNLIHKIKPETQFKNPPLKGLWHKHYFSARFIAKNLQLHHGKNGIQKIISEYFDKGKEITDHDLKEMANRFTFEAFTAREQDGRLTGEWIVFAKHKNENYYLALGEHSMGDQQLYDMIYSKCLPQFKFLSEILYSPS